MQLPGPLCCALPLCLLSLSFLENKGSGNFLFLNTTFVFYTVAFWTCSSVTQSLPCTHWQILLSESVGPLVSYFILLFVQSSHTHREERDSPVDCTQVHAQHAWETRGKNIYSQSGVSISLGLCKRCYHICPCDGKYLRSLKLRHWIPLQVCWLTGHSTKYTNYPFRKMCVKDHFCVSCLLIVYTRYCYRMM